MPRTVPEWLIFGKSYGRSCRTRSGLGAFGKAVIRKPVILTIALSYGNGRR